MEQVIFHPGALAELRDATVYYDFCHLGLGKQFLSAVESLVGIAQVYPRAGRIIRGSFRRLVMKRFPYALIYQEDAEGQLYVVAVMHFNRKPDYWHSRMNDVIR